MSKLSATKDIRSGIGSIGASITKKDNYNLKVFNNDIMHQDRLSVTFKGNQDSLRTIFSPTLFNTCLTTLTKLQLRTYVANKSDNRLIRRTNLFNLKELEFVWRGYFDSTSDFPVKSAFKSKAYLMEFLGLLACPRIILLEEELIENPFKPHSSDIGQTIAFSLINEADFEILKRTLFQIGKLPYLYIFDLYTYDIEEELFADDTASLSFIPRWDVYLSYFLRYRYLLSTEDNIELTKQLNKKISRSDVKKYEYSLLQKEIFVRK